MINNDIKLTKIYETVLVLVSNTTDKVKFKNDRNKFSKAISQTNSHIQ